MADTPSEAEQSPRREQRARDRTRWPSSASRDSLPRCHVCGSFDVVEVGRDPRAGLVAVRCNTCESHSAAADVITQPSDAGGDHAQS